MAKLPSECPIQEIRDVLQSLKDEAFAKNHAGFTSDCVSILGWCAAQSAGAPKLSGGFKSLDEPLPNAVVPTCEEGAAMLQEIADFDEHKKDAGKSSPTIDWQKVATFILALLQQFLGGGGKLIPQNKSVEEKAAAKTAHPHK